MESIFTLAKDEAGQSDGSAANERAVYVVTDIVEPTVDLAGAQTKELRDNLKRAVSDEQSRPVRCKAGIGSRCQDQPDCAGAGNWRCFRQ